jgi:hypothetical protein
MVHVRVGCTVGCSWVVADSSIFPSSKYSQILVNFKKMYKFDLKSKKFEINFIE